MRLCGTPELFLTCGEDKSLPLLGTELWSCSVQPFTELLTEEPGLKHGMVGDLNICQTQILEVIFGREATAVKYQDWFSCSVFVC
jgi:hypothetical protein